MSSGRRSWWVAWIAVHGWCGADLPPTYFQDIAPLIAKHCLGCHESGGLGRVELDTWERVKRYAPEIRLNVGTRNMPPWKAIPGHGRLRNDRSLTVEEIERVTRWTDEGTPAGDSTGVTPKQLAPSRTSKWSQGTPDLVLRLPEYVVPSTGSPETRCFPVRVRLPEGRAVRAVEVKPGNRQAVAHVRVFADPRPREHARKTGDSGYDCFADTEGLLERTSLGEWAAGMQVETLPEGTGRLLPAGADVWVEIRYHRLGRRVPDQSEVGLYFQTGPLRQVVRTHAVANRGLVIPAGQWDYRGEAQWVVPRPIQILSVSPHMNLLGTEMRVRIRRAGKQPPEDLVWVREWDRHWQMAYLLKEPLRIEAGDVVEAVSLFNNTADNQRLGDHPPATARWGWGPFDERMIAFIEYVEIEPAP